MISPAYLHACSRINRNNRHDVVMFGEKDNDYAHTKLMLLISTLTPLFIGQSQIR